MTTKSPARLFDSAFATAGKEEVYNVPHATEGAVGIVCQAEMTENQDVVIAGGSPFKRTEFSGFALNFFNTFSSTSALLGLSRSSDYAASNSYSDSLVPFRRAVGQMQISVKWGMVSGTGLASGGVHLMGGKAPKNDQELYTSLKDVYIQVLENLPDPKADKKLQRSDRLNYALMYLDYKPNRYLAKKAFLKREEEWEPPASPEDYPPEFRQMLPARAGFLVAHESAGDAASAAAGDSSLFSASVRTREPLDRVLLVGNVPSDGANATFSLQCDSAAIGPKYNVAGGGTTLLAMLHKPDQVPGNFSYKLQCSAEGQLDLSKGGVQRSFTTAVVSGTQVSTSKSRKAMDAEPGRWWNVPGMQQLAVTAEGEKVLIVATLSYTANWQDEMTRGVFRILRDGDPLDAGLGVQSVRSVQRGQHRTITVSLVDAPKAGMHLYMLQSTVLVERDESHTLTLTGTRQLALIRCPGEIVSGPFESKTPKGAQGKWCAVTVDKPEWTLIPGLEAKISVPKPSKVMVVYHVNCNPAAMKYAAHFSLFRGTEDGQEQNLGGSDVGLWCTSSQAKASAEYPAGIFTDTPQAGTFIYKLKARSADGAPIDVGPDGSIAAIILADE